MARPRRRPSSLEASANGSTSRRPRPQCEQRRARRVGHRRGKVSLASGVDEITLRAASVAHGGRPQATGEENARDDAVSSKGKERASRARDVRAAVLLFTAASGAELALQARAHAALGARGQPTAGGSARCASVAVETAHANCVAARKARAVVACRQARRGHFRLGSVAFGRFIGLAGDGPTAAALRGGLRAAPTGYDRRRQHERQATRRSSLPLAVGR